jgi:hypothetical protein
MNDTSEEARKKQLEIIFSKTPEERFLMGIEMINYVRMVVENSIRAENPAISPIDLKVAVFKRYYGNEFSQEEIERIEESMRKYHLTHQGM